MDDNDTVFVLIGRYKPQILRWFETHDSSLVNILTMSTNLEKRNIDLTLEDIAMAVIKLLHQESIISRYEAKELKRIIKQFSLGVDTIALKRRHLSLPMITGLLM